MARPASLAEHYRRHRAEMELVLAGGATSPKDARKQLDTMQAWERLRATQAMLEAKRTAPPLPPRFPADEGDRDRQPWMMRD